MENRNRDFWNETKHIRSSRNISVNFVDGACEPHDIADIFATKYQALYTCVSYSCSDMSQIRCDVTDSVAGTGYNDYCLFSKSDIENAVKRLKPCKRDHFRFACCDFYVRVTSILWSVDTWICT